MTKRLSVAAILVLGVTTLFGKAEAKTKSNPDVEVNIPFSFQLGNRTLPPGRYKFELATGTPDVTDSVSVLVVRNVVRNIVRNNEAPVYQSLAVPVKTGVGLPTESRVLFGGGEQHVLVALWENGNRFDLQPAMLAAADNADEWTDGEQLVSVASRSSE